MPLDTQAPEPKFAMEWQASCPDSWSTEYSDDADYARTQNGIQSPDAKQWAFCTKGGTGFISISKYDDGTIAIDGKSSDQPAS